MLNHNLSLHSDCQGHEARQWTLEVNTTKQLEFSRNQSFDGANKMFCNKNYKHGVDVFNESHFLRCDNIARERIKGCCQTFRKISCSYNSHFIRFQE